MVLLKSKNGNPVFGHSSETSQAVLSQCAVVYNAKQYGPSFSKGWLEHARVQSLIFR